jgi:hypothetical protein
MAYVITSSLSIAPVMKKGLGLYQVLFFCLLNLRFNFISRWIKNKSQSTLRAIFPDGFVSNPFEPVTSFLQSKEVTKKGLSLLKFLTAQKGLF